MKKNSFLIKVIVAFVIFLVFVSVVILDPEMTFLNFYENFGLISFLFIGIGIAVVAGEEYRKRIKK